MWKHKRQIPIGQKGDISYIEEELTELIDAREQDVNNIWPLIEASDVIGAVGKFTWKQYRVPLIVIVLLAYIRKPYKLVRNFILDFMGVEKHK